MARTENSLSASRKGVSRCPVGLVILALAGLTLPLWAAPSWPEALGSMPLQGRVTQLNRTNCVELLLNSFQSNSIVKAMVFMPGATDEFYMFRRATANLTNAAPTLFDAVAALTNQTLIRVTFRAPLLLLHTDEDPIEPRIEVAHEPTIARLKKARFVPHAIFNDRDWDYVQPILKRNLKVAVFPFQHMYVSWHFYRHSLAGWNLNGWEAMEAIALAGKTGITIQRKKLVFELDERVRGTPKFDVFPR